MIIPNSVKLLIPLVAVLLLCVTSCCDTPKAISDKYFEGYIINRAEKDYPIGIIRFKDIFEDQEELESPARAIVYHVNDNNDIMNLHESVYFRIYGYGKNQVAGDIRRDSSEIGQSNIASNSELYDKLEDISLNLHNSDMHREGPKHTRRHIKNRPGTNRYQGSDLKYYVVVEAEEEFSTEVKKFLVAEDELSTAGSNYYYFEEKTVQFSALPASLISLSIQAVTLSTTHDHTF